MHSKFNYLEKITIIINKLATINFFNTALHYKLNMEDCYFVYFIINGTKAKQYQS